MLTHVLFVSQFRPGGYTGTASVPARANSTPGTINNEAMFPPMRGWASLASSCPCFFPRGPQPQNGIRVEGCHGCRTFSGQNLMGLKDKQPTSKKTVCLARCKDAFIRCGMRCLVWRCRCCVLFLCALDGVPSLCLRHRGSREVSCSAKLHVPAGSFFSSPPLPSPNENLPRANCLRNVGSPWTTTRFPDELSFEHRTQGWWRRLSSFLENWPPQSREGVRRNWQNGRRPFRHEPQFR